MDTVNASSDHSDLRTNDVIQALKVTLTEAQQDIRQRIDANPSEVRPATCSDRMMPPY
jgi:hypothetical protein